MYRFKSYSTTLISPKKIDVPKSDRVIKILCYKNQFAAITNCVSRAKSNRKLSQIDLIKFCFGVQATAAKKLFTPSNDTLTNFK